MGGESKPQEETKVLVYHYLYGGLPADSNADIIYAKGKTGVQL
jgi:hypothetical protein